MKYNLATQLPMKSSEHNISEDGEYDDFVLHLKRTPTYGLMWCSGKRLEEVNKI